MFSPKAQFWLFYGNKIFFLLKINFSLAAPSWLAKNKAIMDYALDYAKIVQIESKVIEAINYVRIHKKMILPCELVGCTE